MKKYHTIIPAAYLVIIDKNKVLLLRRANTGYFDGFYSLPAGHMELGESATTTAIREAQEEVGIMIDSKDLTLGHILYRKQDDHERIDMFFKVKKYSGVLENMEPHKCDELRWCAIDQLPDKIIPEVKQALESIALEKMYSEFNF